MAKQIKLTYDGQDYTLEYTRKSVEKMEQAGFVVSEVKDKPVSTLPVLFAGAFLAHHRWVKQDIIDEIYETIPNKESFMSKLVEMYAEPIEALFDEPKGDAEKNATWEVNF